MNCSCGNNTVFLHCLNETLSLHNDGRVDILPRTARGETPVFCAVWDCAYSSLLHIRSVPHSGDELDLRHQPVELLRLQEQVADVHRTSTTKSHSNPASALPSIHIPPWAGGESLPGRSTGCAVCPTATSGAFWSRPVAPFAAICIQAPCQNDGRQRLLDDAVAEEALALHFAAVPPAAPHGPGLALGCPRG